MPFWAGFGGRCLLEWSSLPLTQILVGMRGDGADRGWWSWRGGGVGTTGRCWRGWAASWACCARIRRGLTTEELLERVGYGDGPRASRMRTLNRDLAALAEDGWRIDTLPTANTPARRVLRTVDNRFATLFTDAERAQLARAAACAGPGIADALAEDLGRSAEAAGVRGDRVGRGGPAGGVPGRGRGSVHA